MTEESHHPFVDEWVLKPGVSRSLLSFIVVSHGLALLVVLCLFGLVGWLAFPTVLIIASLVYNYLLHSSCFSKRWIKQVCWREFDGWELITGDEQHFPAVLCHHSFQSRFLTVLNFKARRRSGRRSFTIILLPDSISQKQISHLRRRLKLLREVK